MSFRDQRLGAMLIALAGLCLASCSQPVARGPTAAGLVGITSFNKRYLQSIDDGDFATLSRLTTPDHIMMAPGIPAIVGKSANDDANRRSIDQYRVVESWAPVETVIEGGLAFQRGTFSSALTPKGGGATRSIDGKFLRIYRRDADGNWTMYIDMFNGDAPERLQ